MLNFTIQGKVKAKQSVKIGRNGIKYTPADVVEYANYVKLCFKQAYPNWDIQEFEETPLRVLIKVFYPIPKSFSKKKHIEASLGFLRPITKPDCDNIAKSICDALNGIAYRDDRQIATLAVRKEYTSKVERVEVTIETEQITEEEKRILGLAG